MSSATTATRRPRRDLVNGLMSIWGVVVFVFLFLPIVMIVIYSFNDGRALVVWQKFGLAPFSNALADRTIRDAVFTSIRAAAGASVIATILGSLAGIALARRPGKWTIAFLGLVFLVLVTPEIVDAISLLIWYVRIGGPFGPDNQIFNYGLIRLFIGHALFAIGGRDADRARAPRGARRVARGGLRRPLRVADPDVPENHAPLMMPAVLAGALLAFSLSLDNTIISSFVSTANASPWPVYVFSSLRSILRPEIAAMSTLVLLLTLFALALVAIVLRRGGASGEEAAAMIVGAGGRLVTDPSRRSGDPGFDLVLRRHRHASAVTAGAPGPLPGVPHGDDHRSESEDRTERPGGGVHDRDQPDAGEDRPAGDEGDRRGRAAHAPGHGPRTTPPR